MPAQSGRVRTTSSELPLVDGAVSTPPRFAHSKSARTVRLPTRHTLSRFVATNGGGSHCVLNIPVSSTAFDGDAVVWFTEVPVRPFPRPLEMTIVCPARSHAYPATNSHVYIEYVYLYVPPSASLFSFNSTRLREISSAEKNDVSSQSRDVERDLYTSSHMMMEHVCFFQ